MKTAEDVLKEKGHDLVSVAPSATVAEALHLMGTHRIGAVLVKGEGEAVIGIWTERDLTRDILAPEFDARRDPIAKYMVTSLVYAAHNENLYQMQDKFLGRRLRHLLVSKAEKCIGIVSAGDVMRMLLNEMKSELDQANLLASWEYYENWRWV